MQRLLSVAILLPVVGAVMLSACSGSESTPVEPKAPSSAADQAAPPGRVEAPDSESSEAAPPEADPQPPLTGDPPSFEVRLNHSPVRAGFTVYVHVQSASGLLTDPADRPVRVEFEGEEGTRTLAEVEVNGFSSGVPAYWSGPIEFPQAGGWQAHVVTEAGNRYAGPLVSVLAPPNLLEPDGRLPAPRVVNEIWLLDGATARLIASDATGGDVAWIGEPSRVVYWQRSGGKSRVVAVDVATGAAERLLETRGDSLLASADGMALLVRDRRPEPERMQLLDVASGIWREVEVRGRSVRASWAPAGALLIVLDDTGVRLLRPDGAVMAEHALPEADLHQVAWSPDGAFAVLGPTADGAYVVDAVSGAMRTLLRAEDMAPELFGPRGSTAVSPDGSRLAISWADGEGWSLVIAAADATRQAILGAEPVLRMPGDPERFFANWILGLSWSPVGDRLAFTVGPSEAEGLWIRDVTGGALTRVAAPPAGQGFYLDAPVWARDGARLGARRSTCFHACDGPPWGAAVIDAASGEVVWEEEGGRFLPRLWQMNPLFTDGGGVRVGMPPGAYTVAAPDRFFSAAVSPDGERAAVLGQQVGGVGFRYAIQADGSAHRRVGPTESASSPPTGRTSPSGELEARFTSRGVEVADAEGNLTLISDVLGGVPVVWSPDGSAVAFTSEETLSRGDIIVAAADGSGAYVLVEGGDLREWRADGSIVYEVYYGGA